MADPDEGVYVRERLVRAAAVGRPLCQDCFARHLAAETTLTRSEARAYALRESELSIHEVSRAMNIKFGSAQAHLCRVRDKRHRSALLVSMTRREYLDVG